MFWWIGVERGVRGDSDGHDGVGIRLVERAKAGDINLVMDVSCQCDERMMSRSTLVMRNFALGLCLVAKAYEQEIRTPVKSLIAGQLMEAVLIQFQKAKVDSEAALLTLDQVLQANEINFELMATIPVGTVYFHLILLSLFTSLLSTFHLIPSTGLGSR